MATEAEAPALMFKKHMTNQPRFTKKRIATTTIATSTATSTTFDSVMFLYLQTRPDHYTESPSVSCAFRRALFERAVGNSSLLQQAAFAIMPERCLRENFPVWPSPEIAGSDRVP